MLVQELKELKEILSKHESKLDQMLNHHHTKQSRVLEKLQKELPALKRAAAKQVEELEQLRKWHTCGGGAPNLTARGTARGDAS